MPNPNILTPTYLTGLVEARPTQADIRKQYMGLKYLPLREVYEWQLTWDEVRSRNNMAGIYAMDGKPIPGYDMKFKQYFQDVVNLMATRTLTQQDVMTLRQAGEPVLTVNAARAAEERATRRLRERVAWCDDSLESAVEYLCMGALQGQIDWPPKSATGAAIAAPPAYWGNATFSLVYPIPAAFKQAATTLSSTIGGVTRNGGGISWITSTATPIDDLEVINELMTDTLGMSLDGATVIMSRRVMSYLAKNASVIAWVQGTERGTNFVNTADFKSFMETKFGYNIVFYDAQWTYETGIDTDTPTINRVNYMPAGRVLIIPPGETLGYTATAPHLTPSGDYKTGKYVWTYQEPEPPFDYRLGVGMTAFPVLERATSLFVFEAWS